MRKKRHCATAGMSHQSSSQAPAWVRVYLGGLRRNDTAPVPSRSSRQERITAAQSGKQAHPLRHTHPCGNRGRRDRSPRVT